MYSLSPVVMHISLTSCVMCPYSNFPREFDHLTFPSGVAFEFLLSQILTIPHPLPLGMGLCDWRLIGILTNTATCISTAQFMLKSASMQHGGAAGLMQYAALYGLCEFMGLWFSGLWVYRKLLYLKNSLEKNVAFFHASLADVSNTKSISCEESCEVSCETECQASLCALVIWFISRVAIDDYIMSQHLTPLTPHKYVTEDCGMCNCGSGMRITCTVPSTNCFFYDR